jgi:hypothetical protein
MKWDDIETGHWYWVGPFEDGSFKHMMCEQKGRGREIVESCLQFWGMPMNSHDNVVSMASNQLARYITYAYQVNMFPGYIIPDEERERLENESKLPY